MREIDLHQELNALGIRFEPIGYTKAPNCPYGVYYETITVSQPDAEHSARVVTHDIEIAVYDATLKELQAPSATVKAWINSLPINYRKEVQYVIDEKQYCALYTLKYSTKRKD